MTRFERLFKFQILLYTCSGIYPGPALPNRRGKRPRGAMNQGGKGMDSFILYDGGKIPQIGLKNWKSAR